MKVNSECLNAHTCIISTFKKVSITICFCKSARTCMKLILQVAAL